MASLVIDDLSEEATQRLVRRAAAHGRTPEAEARAILEAATSPDDAPREESLGDLSRRLFGPENGFDLGPYLAPREGPTPPITFD